MDCFQNLYVLDLANNHQGSVNHAKQIIQNLAEVITEAKVHGVLKFQFRQLDTFIHRNHRDGSGSKHISRFLSTELSRNDFQVLFDEAKANQLKTMCTPFDEESVEIIAEMKFDFIKVASCSARDWPLLEKVANSGLPTVASTGGLDLGEIDELVSFFEHRGNPFALMHCISIYPTPDELCNLNIIDELSERYPHLPIGWSTHETPDNTLPGQIAISKGAKILERHVGLESGEFKLNAYSSSPEQIKKWIDDCERARIICGKGDVREKSAEETDSLNSLARGTYASREIMTGETITRQDIYFAMPFQTDQLASGDFRPGAICKQNIQTDAPVFMQDVKFKEEKNTRPLKKALHLVKAQLRKAKIHLHQDFKVEFSHHRGIQKFDEIGATIIDCINREYCKKIIVQTPGQSHPTHYHKKKEESFQLLWGDMRVNLDGKEKDLILGEIILVQPGVWHGFSTQNGCVFEEISTTHFNNDSFYKDATINDQKRERRKTVVENWGRFQI